MSTRRNFFKQAALTGLAAAVVPTSLRAEQLFDEKQSQKRLLRIAHITDVHILDQSNAETCFARALREINALKDKPDLIINTGDTVMDENKQTTATVEKRWRVWNSVVKAENRIRMISALGNHDVWYGPDEVLDQEYKKDVRYGKQWAIQELALPNRYYSMEVDGWQFIALDSINGEVGYQLDDGQFDWLGEELATLDVKRPVCIFSHVPIISACALLYYTQRNNALEVNFPSGDMHVDHKRIKDLFYKHKNVKLCLSGHVHYIDAVEYLGVKYLCNGAMSGNWWRDPLALDEFPPVYALIDLYEDGTSLAQVVKYNSVV